MSIEAMKQALEALEDIWGYLPTKKAWPQDQVDEAIQTLRQAIAEAEKQEPVIGTKTWFEDGKMVTQHLYASDISQERVDETGKDRHEWVGLDGDIPSLGLVTEEFYNGMLCAEDILRKRNTRREWVGLATGEAREFYESNLSREELIHKIDEFLQEKNT